MEFANSARYSLGALAVAAVCAGCAGGWSPTGSAPAGLIAPMGIRSGLHVSVHPDRRHSWMLGGLQGKALLYVSDIGAEAVDVFSYPEDKLVGTLTGFDEPNGLCVDAKGNVFVTNTYAGNILKYAHGGTKPIATLQDGGYFSSSCAVDPTTGNLAVANIGGPSLEEGNVVIFTHAKGIPKTYASSTLSSAFYCGYDNAGNLFVDGFSSDGMNLLVALREGSSTFAQIFMNGVKLGWPGGVQWHNGHVNLGDQYANKFVTSEPYPNVIYELTVTNQKGTLIKTVPLIGGADVVQYWIQGKTIIGPDAQNDQVGFWPTAGGKYRSLLTGFYEPVGATVSPGQ